MQIQLKRYAITIRGKVQHIGYRGIIEGAARKTELKAYIFNDTDNSVKIVCEGSKKSVDNFLSALKEFARADIESIGKKEIHESFPFLDGIKTDTGAMRGTLNSIDGSSGEFIVEQRGHNQRLEKILEKPTEK